MRFLIIAVGRGRGTVAVSLYNNYSERIRTPIRLIEVEARGKMSVPERRARESAAICNKLPPNAIVIALDERGVLLSSEDLSTRILRWTGSGHSEVAFLIGGADGHHASIIKRADLVLSLGPMTWPHLLVRGMIAEQLYRAECLIAGHPYHRK